MHNIDILAKDIFKLATFFGKDSMYNFGEISTNIQLINVLGAFVWGNKFAEHKGGRFNLGKMINMDMFGKVGKFIKDLF